MQHESSKRNLYKVEHAAKDREVSAEGDNLGKVRRRPIKLRIEEGENTSDFLSFHWFSLGFL